MQIKEAEGLSDFSKYIQVSGNWRIKFPVLMSV